MIDFTNCRIIPGRAYNGANGSKVAVSHENAVYMIKMLPSTAPAVKNENEPPQPDLLPAESRA